MIPTPFHGYHPDNSDHVALVRVEPTADRGMYMLRISRGPTRKKLRQTSTLGPYSEEDLVGQFSAAVAELRQEGYWPGGVLTLLERLEEEDPVDRAMAALRLGWRQTPEAVNSLLEILPESVDESCSILDALGMIGDARAVPAVREYAERKLLSRRRSAGEALRQIGDAESVQQVSQRAMERLPDALKTIVQSDEGTPTSRMESLTEAFFALDTQQQALALDTLYEIATPLTVATVQKVLTKLHFAQAFIWRAVKSVFKRSMLRHDYVTFGLLSYLIEKQGRSTKGTSAHAKSGYDGSMKHLPIFTRTTQDYLRRLSWRYLRDVARYRPGEYAHAAAETVIHYLLEDMIKYGYERCYLLHQVLLGNSQRYDLDGRKMRFRRRVSKKPPPGLREEAYPGLWDAQPTAYLRLLGAALLPEVHAFAVEAVKNRHPLLIRQASHQQVLNMLSAPFEATLEMALAELDRRFDPEKPDWGLLRQMLDDERSLARTIGQRWLRLTAHLWLGDADRIFDFLSIQQANIRASVVEMVVSALHENPPLRRVLAERILALLRAPKEAAVSYVGYATVAHEALAGELAGLVSVAELATWIASGSDEIKAMAGELLRQRPEAVAELGLERLTALAQHELVSVRAAAQTLIHSAVQQLSADPSLLFVLVESDWPDTRAMAFELLRDKIDLSALGLDGLMGLLDSNRTEVQDLGKELTQKQMVALPGDELVLRLVQHPHPNMRHFALELAVQHLPENSQSLAQLKTFCRSALLDLWPNREVKQLVTAFLTARGVEDSAQAEVATAILGDIVRMQGRRDGENALEALVRIQLAQPEVPSTVKLVGGVED